MEVYRYTAYVDTRKEYRSVVLQFDIGETHLLTIEVTKDILKSYNVSIVRFDIVSQNNFELMNKFLSNITYSGLQKLAEEHFKTATKQIQLYTLTKVSKTGEISYIRSK